MAAVNASVSNLSFSHLYSIVSISLASLYCLQAAFVCPLTARSATSGIFSSQFERIKGTLSVLLPLLKSVAQCVSAEAESDWVPVENKSPRKNTQPSFRYLILDICFKSILGAFLTQYRKLLIIKKKLVVFFDTLNFSWCVLTLCIQFCM